MTHNDIIEMARKAGFVDYELDDGTTNAFDKRYKTFAKLVAEKAIKEALAQPEQEPAVGEQAPENSLPTWSECNLIIENDEFRKRAEVGLEGQVLDTPRTTPEPTALHRFIHEYDDSDPYRSAWFLHRLECVLKEVTTPPQRKPLTNEQLAKLGIPPFGMAYEQARAIEAAHGIKGY